MSFIKYIDLIFVFVVQISAEFLLHYNSLHSTETSETSFFFGGMQNKKGWEQKSYNYSMQGKRNKEKICLPNAFPQHFWLCCSIQAVQITRTGSYAFARGLLTFPPAAAHSRPTSILLLSWKQGLENHNKAFPGPAVSIFFDSRKKNNYLPYNVHHGASFKSTSLVEPLTAEPFDIDLQWHF